MDQFLTEERVQALFSAIDVDQTNKITEKNIIDAFSKFGREVSNDEMKEIMGEHDTEKTGYLNIEEFRNIF